MIATRLAFGQFLAEIGENMPELVVLDAEMSNSTFTNLFQEKFPNRFVQCFIAEQNMLSTALGLSIGGMVPVCATFAAFLTRCLDQIRMSQYSFPKTNLKIVGSHCGISIGSDGPSQMALEDIAMFGTIHDSIILYPSGETATRALTKLLLDHHGISYLRLTRDEMPDLYGEKFSKLEIMNLTNSKENLNKTEQILENELENQLGNSQIVNLGKSQKSNSKPFLEENSIENSNENVDFNFKIGGSFLFKNSKKSNTNSRIILENSTEKLPKITLIGAGITTHECLKAQEIMQEATGENQTKNGNKTGNQIENKAEIQVVDLYSVKPFDQLTILQTALESQFLISAEDHSPFGGISSIISTFLAGFNIVELKTEIQNWQNNSQNSSEKLEIENLETETLKVKILENEKLTSKFEKNIEGKNGNNSQQLEGILKQIKLNLDSHNLSTFQKIDFNKFLKNLEVDPKWRGIYSLSVGEIPRSGSKEKLLEWAKIDAKGIVEKIEEILG